MWQFIDRNREEVHARFSCNNSVSIIIYFLRSCMQILLLSIVFRVVKYFTNLKLFKVIKKWTYASIALSFNIYFYWNGNETFLHSTFYYYSITVGALKNMTGLMNYPNNWANICAIIHNYIFCNAYLQIIFCCLKI